MIKLEQVSKRFDNVVALNNLSLSIDRGSIYGLIGSNGAGKSTFLRIISGIYLPTSGTATIDGQNVYENTALKERIFYISDDQFFYNDSSMNDLAKYFSIIYPKFSFDDFQRLSNIFNLEKTQSLSTFSKGMQKQAHIALALSCRPEYMLCDETFDGLDPVMRLAVKKLLAEAVVNHSMTPIISSHNLRDLDDICDHVGLLHKGGLVFENDIDNLKSGITKIQCAFDSPVSQNNFPDLDIISIKSQGKMHTIIVRDEKDYAEKSVSIMKPLYMETLPLSLDEIFILEMEGLGYDAKKI